MAKLRIKNSNNDTDIVLEMAENEQNILTVMRDAEVYVKSSCGGHATCGDCMIKVVSGEDNLSPPPFEEIKLLGNVFHITKERLGCQTKITGDVTIDISHHDEAADQKKLKNKKHNRNKPKRRRPEEVKEILDERKAASEEKTKMRDNKDEAYFEHWKKEKDPAAPPKKLDGGKRPQPFVVPDLEPITSKSSDELDKSASADKSESEKDA